MWAAAYCCRYIKIKGLLTPNFWILCGVIKILKVWGHHFNGANITTFSGMTTLTTFYWLISCNYCWISTKNTNLQVIPLKISLLGVTVT